MKPQLVDLHVHTDASDGSDHPVDVVRQAKRMGLAAIAVTDHDTVSGLDEACAEGSALGLDVIRGCELSCTSPYGEVHILGLWLPECCASFERKLAELRERRKRRNDRMLARLREIGILVDEGELAALAVGDSVGRPHIAKAMMVRGYVGSVEEAFSLYLGKGGAAFVPMEPFTPVEAVDLLAGVGAMPVLAHPMLIRCPPPWREALIGELAGCGLGAVEAYHSEHSQGDERYLVGLAARYGVGVSGGSDYHGTVKPGIYLGRGRGSLRVTTAILEMLRSRRRISGLPINIKRFPCTFCH